MSRREEIRVPALAEPISHYTDAVRADGLLFVSGCVAVDGAGALVGAGDVVAQARQVFANLQAVLTASGAAIENVVKVTVFLTEMADRAAVNTVRQEVFGERAAGEHPGRGLRARRARRAGRDRGRGAGAVSDPFNAVITEVEPAAAAPGPLHGKRLLVKDLIDVAGVRTTYGSSIYADHVPRRTASAVDALVAAGAVVTGKANLHEFAWGVTSQNPWYGTVQNPALPGRTAGGSSGGNAAALAAGLCDLGLGTDTGCSIRLPAACCGVVGLKPAWGRIALDGVYPLCPTFDTVGPMARTVAEVALAWGVLTGERPPAPRLRGLRVGLLTRPPSVGGPALPPNPAAESYVERLEALGAVVEEATLPEPPEDTWPLFFHEAAEAHRATFPARAADYGENVRGKLELAQAVDPAAVAAARDAVAAWRGYRPGVDLYVAPVLGVEVPPVDCDELEVRLPATAFLRPFNVLGWAALAIGDLQLVAPRDEVVLAAGLAWEREERPVSSSA